MNAKNKYLSIVENALKDLNRDYRNKAIPEDEYKKYSEEFKRAIYYLKNDYLNIETAKSTMETVCNIQENKSFWNKFKNPEYEDKKIT